MKRLVSALAVVVLLLGLAPMAMAAGPTRHYDRVQIDKIDPSFRPMLADAKRKITVVLELAASPAAARGLSATQQRQRAQALRSAQGKLDPRIKALGGRSCTATSSPTTASRCAPPAPSWPSSRRCPGGRRAAPRHLQADQRQRGPVRRRPDGVADERRDRRGQTIAVIDTGIDYTHANFGGPGTVAAYDANNPTIIEPGTFPTAKVIADYDFAATATTRRRRRLDDADARPDPLDCFDHGTHVSGTAAGQGVLANHSTYNGPYDPSIYNDPNKFVVGPGVAPRAKLIALKVFGCEGSTDLVVDALEWVAAYNVSHLDGIDVVNMSLGAPFGANDDPDAIATNNLVSMGVVVVASAGNEADVPFITARRRPRPRRSASPRSTRSGAAPRDRGPSVGHGHQRQQPNAFPGLPVSGTLHVVPNGTGGVSLGCAAADYDAASAGKIVAIKRGVCAFVDKGAAAAAAGAIGIIDINRDDTAVGDLPTFIGYNPELFQIPMVGVDKTAQPTLLAAEGAAITLKSNGTAASPTYKQIADFSSSGPRYGDNWLKPDVAARASACCRRSTAAAERPRSPAPRWPPR
jgi:subtilisin family serine protease